MSLFPDSEPPTPNEAIYDSITRNPWDKTVTDLLLNNLQDGNSRGSRILPEWVEAQGFKKMVEQMRTAKTLEEKYQLLAQEAPIHRHYHDYYFPYKTIHWYDVIQGFVYNIRPPKVDRDPFLDYPDSVYTCLENTLNRKEFRWETGIDLGSGPGETARILAPRCDRVMAIDLFNSLHSIARERDAEKGIKNINYVTADIAKQGIPLKDHSAGAVVSNGLTAFIPQDQLEPYVSEIARVLKPGGSYFEPEISGGGMLARAIKEEFTDDAKTLLAYLIGELVTSPSEGKSGSYPHSSSEIENIFAEHKFKPIEYGSTQMVYYTGVSTIRYVAS